ncbi:MAG: hypothetical protein QOJ60_69 [Actinomycetota bacterium]|jgi:hypothetical protein|nr:hypothetical protein [Actinomycetota bacterium]
MIKMSPFISLVTLTALAVIVLIALPAMVTSLS